MSLSLTQLSALVEPPHLAGALTGFDHAEVLSVCPVYGGSFDAWEVQTSVPLPRVLLLVRDRTFFLQLVAAHGIEVRS